MEKTTKNDNGAPKRLPRGHAYMRFRNRGYVIHVDFEKADIPWLEGIIKAALREMAKRDKEAEKPC